MKTLSSLLTLVVLLTLSAWSPAAAAPQPPNADLTYQGSTSVTIDASGQWLGTASDKDKEKPTGSVSSEIFFWRTATGNIQIQLNTSSISSTGSAIDKFSSDELFELLSRAGIQKAMQMGLVTLNSNTTVYTDGCYTRTGSGSTTSFTVCSPRVYVANWYTIKADGTIVKTGSSNGASLK